MDEQLTISTPEQVAFHYEVAGIGSRFVAALLDHVILGVVLTLIFCAMSSIGTVVAMSSEQTGYIVLALLVLVVFVIFWGYFVVFELAWNGQTPGKRAGGLRVIRRSGQPVGAGEVMIRNLLRLVDILPGFYGVGLVTMFIDKEARRLGDFAANTIVVREGQETRLRDVRTTATTQYGQGIDSPFTSSRSPSAYGQYATQEGFTPPPGYDAMYSRPSPQPVYATTRQDPLPGISLREVTAEDYRLMREMLARAARGELPQARTQELAYRLAQGVAGRMGHDFREWQSRGWEPIVFLQSVLEAQEVRGS
ncbi:MAG: RDD family protein [Chloroflexota bacterium]|nr:RDD family protein [Chloroflexota bacterium]